MGLAAVRDLRPHLRLETPDEIQAFELDMLAEFVLARASAGITDTTISADVAAVVGLRNGSAAAVGDDRPGRGPVLRRRSEEPGSGQKVLKAAAFAVFFEFLELRHRPAIHAATGFVVESPLDEVTGRAAGPARGCGSRQMRGRSTSCSPAGAPTCSPPASTPRPPGTTPRCGWLA